MLAIDTNILVRLVVADDPVQSEQARMILAENRVFIATTVLLETAWVLGRTYRLERSKVAESFRTLFGLSQVTFQDREGAALALSWADHGMDFADALHLAAAKDCEAFSSFDKQLRTLAAALSPIPVRSP